ncbi:unknown [Spodoptera litura nucleopolyhedrovirus II]|uniref:hypothetical protein n=1 Tax=Spodoptera litura nucleopolyhedrovirus II TaxID=566270 RepID=UPI000187465B|nr:hypothetical protein SlnV2_gp029 [Spodoptera litura nucleopolyhedrovirus II]ACI47398.1 unknown [Spodoptera litura nucleopolyhedrovirus II]
MYEFDKSFLKVFTNDDDEELLASSSHYNATNKRLTQSYNISRPSVIKVTLDSQNSLLQAVFQCEDRIMCIVNARDASQPIVFDGFVDEQDDECKTKMFCVGALKELNEEHGLCVRDMVRAMESPTILHIYVNEAKISTDPHKNINLANCISDNGAHFDDLINRLRANSEMTQRRRRPTKSNLTRWAPVSCKTGRHLLTATIILNNYSFSKI